MLCDTCVNAGTASYKYPCNCCDMIEGSSRCKYKKVRTHADRIRAMSDEELAKWLARTQYANMMEDAEIFGAQLPFEEETLKGAEQECLQWLKQPAEE